MERMLRLRLRQRVRIALIAIAALLWSQLALAGHADCLMIAPGVPAEVAAAHHGCEGQMPTPEQPMCDAHCSHGDATAESARIPPLPPMLGAPPVPRISVAAIAKVTEHRPECRFGLPPPVSWHRPTAHPASLLLI